MLRDVERTAPPAPLAPGFPALAKAGNGPRQATFKSDRLARIQTERKFPTGLTGGQSPRLGQGGATAPQALSGRLINAVSTFMKFGVLCGDL